jgi:hypothetical protein
MPRAAKWLLSAAAANAEGAVYGTLMVGVLLAAEDARGRLAVSTVGDHGEGLQRLAPVTDCSSRSQRCTGAPGPSGIPIRYQARKNTVHTTRMITA